MNPVEVYSKRGKRRYLVDADRYTRVSRSRSLCGKTGKDYWIPNAVYFYGVHWKMCKECERLSKPNTTGEAALPARKEYMKSKTRKVTSLDSLVRKFQLALREWTLDSFGIYGSGCRDMARVLARMARYGETGEQAWEREFGK